LTRRKFLGTAALGAAGLALEPWNVLAQSARTPVARGGSFPAGVASGQPTTTGATLWTRVAGLERTSRLQVELSRDADFRSVLYRQDVVADADRGFAVHHRVEHPVLRTGEQYFYRFFTCDQDSRVGRVRLARPADSREPVRVGFFSCQKYHAGWYTALAGLAAEPDLDLVVSLGDYIYEERNTNQPIPERQDRLGANGDGEVQTLEEFRAKYALYQSDNDLQALHAAHPFVAIWDDHEVEDNYAGDQRGDVEQPRFELPVRRANGYRAFFESLPIIPARRDVIYGRIPLGANADVLLLDERQYRSKQICGELTPCPEARTRTDVTLLGGEQKAWLKDALASSPATWKLVGNQVMIMSVDVPTGVPINADQWDGYEAERRELMQFCLDRGVKDVSFLTGDIHTFFAGAVTTDGRITGTPAATEFVGGSITSGGIAEAFGGDQRISDRIREANPHIVYTDTKQRGYGVAEARPDELLVTFRAPDTILAPTSPVRTLASFRVERGSTAVVRTD
jgi:alkaline phosphatase D